MTQRYPVVSRRPIPRSAGSQGSIYTVFPATRPVKPVRVHRKTLIFFSPSLFDSFEPGLSERTLWTTILSLPIATHNNNPVLHPSMRGGSRQGLLSALSDRFGSELTRSRAQTSVYTSASPPSGDIGSREGVSTPSDPRGGGRGGGIIPA